MYLTDEFIDTYTDKTVPFGGNGLGHFVYLRTYSRWLEDKGRRETWIETCRRVVEYSMRLYQGPSANNRENPYNLYDEAELMFDMMFHLKVFPAGRTLWIGGTEAEKKFGTANFNCSFVVMDKISAFTDLFHLLMVGSGVGFRVLPGDVFKLPVFNPKIVVAHKPYNGKIPTERREDTVMFEEKEETIDALASVHIVVGDSKQGWVQALDFYLQSMQRKDVESIIFNYDSVRPAGEILKTFGGRASGHSALKRMFRNIHKIIERTKNNNYVVANSGGYEYGPFDQYGRLSTLDVLDINNHIGYNVVVGGVRRTAQIALFDSEDNRILNAKVGLWEQGSNNYGNDQRSMSNNSIFFEQKPSKEQLLDIFERIQHNGEPGFVNAVAARERRPNFKGLNPCAEILLDDRGVCNLTEVNLRAFVDTSGGIDYEGLFKAVRLATRIGLRQTNTTLDLPEWDFVQKRDRLTGVSLDGVMDFVDAHNATEENLIHLLQLLRRDANDEARQYAYHMRVPQPLLVTTIKPSGTISKLPGISSGIHRGRAPYYIRRVRITASDPLAKAMYDAGYRIYPENNSNGPSVEAFDSMGAVDKWAALNAANTWVIEFPVQSATKVAVDSESAIEQFERYLLFQRHWTDHNTSITINFSPNEVDALVDSILENWHSYVAVSFLPKDTTAYPLLPEEPITAEEFEERSIEIYDINPHYIEKLLTQYEVKDQASELLDPSCDTGICPVR